MLKKINNNLYTCFLKENNMLFTFEHGGIGVYSAGLCWRLFLTYSNQKTLFACFVTRSDGHSTEKQYSQNGKIWRDSEALTHAEAMIYAFLEE